MGRSTQVPQLGRWPVSPSPSPPSSITQESMSITPKLASVEISLSLSFCWNPGPLPSRPGLSTDLHVSTVFSLNHLWRTNQYDMFLENSSIFPFPTQRGHLNLDSNLDVFVRRIQRDKPGRVLQILQRQESADRGSKFESSRPVWDK